MDRSFMEEVLDAVRWMFWGGVCLAVLTPILLGIIVYLIVTD